LGVIQQCHVARKVKHRGFQAILCEQNPFLEVAIARLREILSAQGADPLQSDIDVAMAIFQSGLSTKKDVTEISGRGVGMPL
jgi:hypothetical protein